MSAASAAAAGFAAEYRISSSTTSRSIAGRRHRCRCVSRVQEPERLIICNSNGKQCTGSVWQCRGPLSVVLLASTGRKRDARLGAGTSTDMTATLLVMESLLEARTPAIPRAGKPGAQQDIPVHGNYKRYYGYRWGAGGGEDPRLQVRLATLPVSIRANVAPAPQYSTAACKLDDMYPGMIPDGVTPAKEYSTSACKSNDMDPGSVPEGVLAQPR